MADFGKLNFSVSFNPTSAFPLDARYYFESKTAADAAAAGAVSVGSADGTYHYGQTVVVVENEVATLYVIEPDKTLKAVGATVLGDGKSIQVQDGTISIIGFEAAEAGAQPRKKADGTIEWIKPDTTTVEGLQTAVEGLESDVGDLQGEIETLTGTGEGSVSKIAQDAADARVNQFATDISEDGTINTFKELVDYVAKHAPEAADMATSIQGLEGEMDQVQTALEGIDEGAQVNAIDTVSSEFTISEEKELSVSAIAMDKITGLPAALEGKVNAVAGSRLMTEAEGEKLAGIDEGAEANVIEDVKLGGVSLQVTGKAVDIPAATASSLGLVKSTDAENGVTVASDGTMQINNVNINKLVQTEGDTLILDGGNAAKQ